MSSSPEGLYGLSPEAGEIAERQGWNRDSLLDLCLTYIHRQQDDDAFCDFLAKVAQEENEEAQENEEECPHADCGYGECSWLQGGLNGACDTHGNGEGRCQEGHISEKEKA